MREGRLLLDERAATKGPIIDCVETDAHLFFEGVEPTSLTARKGPRASIPHGHAQTRSDPELSAFFAWLLAKAGLDARHYRNASLSRRIRACLRAVGARDTEHAYRQIAANPSLIRPAIDAVLLGVTEFGRDRTVFEHLRLEILPQLLQAAKNLRIWSAACSEGPELYSVATLLADAGRLGDCELVGTDCRIDAIDRARSGVFSTDTLAKLDEAVRKRHFALDGSHARVAALLRSAVQWKVANLIDGVEPGPWDLILWRNMAIYLNAESAESIWRKLVGQLRPRGYLVVGKADHPPGGLELQRVVSCIYRRA